MGTTEAAAITARRELGAGFDGELIGPDDASYDEARALFNAMIDKRPAVIARCASPADVAGVIAFARAHDLPLAVRGGGHNGGGLGSVDDGVVADLSLLDSVSVDAAARTVRVGGGCTWADVDAATHAHGLAVPCGIISTTGVGGLTLGGGIGHLTRGYGLTIDNLLAARGGAGRRRARHGERRRERRALLGPAGRRRQLRRRDGVHVPGASGLRRRRRADVLADRAGRRAARRLPRVPADAAAERGRVLRLPHHPPGPPFPEEIHLRKVCGIVWCIVGSDEEAEQAMAPMLAVATPLMHGAGRVPLPGLNSAFDGLYGPGDQWYWRADFVNEIPDEAMARNAEWNDKMPSWKSGSHIYPIDGAAHDVGPAETPWAYRDTRWAQVIIGVDPDPASAPALRDWTVGYWEALHPYSAGGAYVNFMMDEGQERVKATYRDNYDRLAQAKATYDPENVFRVNQNIQPAM